VALAASIAAALTMMMPVLILGAPTPVAALGSFPVLLSIAYIAIFASAIAFLFWTYGVARLGPTRAGQFVNLMPIFGASLAFSVLGEVPTLAQVAGAALVLSGIAFVEAARAILARQQRTAVETGMKDWRGNLLNVSLLLGPKHSLGASRAKAEVARPSQIGRQWVFQRNRDGCEIDWLQDQSPERPSAFI
jgi:EamA-like transporter family